VILSGLLHHLVSYQLVNERIGEGNTGSKDSESNAGKRHLAESLYTAAPRAGKIGLL